MNTYTSYQVTFYFITNTYIFGSIKPHHLFLKSDFLVGLEGTLSGKLIYATVLFDTETYSIEEEIVYHHIHKH